MLQTNTIHPETLAILKKIMAMPIFQQFNLVGGTSLALQIGHRISIDLDLFTNKDFDSMQLLQTLHTMGQLELLVDNPPFLQVQLDGVKLDFLKFPYPIVQEYEVIENIRLVTIENIAIMKLLAIARRGSKKDFFNLYFLLEQFKIADLVSIFENKMPNIGLFHILKSLTYFEDAELENNPKMIIKTKWTTVKKVITEKTVTYLDSL